MGIFYPFLKDNSVDLIGVEAGGSGIELHAAPLSDGSIGVLHGMKLIMQDESGQILSTQSVSAGLDYPERPEHSYLKDSGRVNTIQQQMKKL